MYNNFHFIFMETLIKDILERPDSKINEEIIKLEGMTGTKTRHFYNNLLSSINDPVYLEIGTWKGSSLCSAMYKNKATVICIDNWSEFSGPKQEFLDNFEKYKGENNASFIEQDCFKVDINTLPKCNVYLYDGGHSEEDHYKALMYYYPCLADESVFLVDDWNWQQVRDGTYRAIKDLNVDYKLIEIRTSNDNSTTHMSDGWWNGIGIFILNKK